MKYISPADNTGYSVAARGYLKAILRAGIPVSWETLVPGRGLGLGYQPGVPSISLEPELAECCNRQIPYDRVVIHTVPEYYPHFSGKERERFSSLVRATKAQAGEAQAGEAQAGEVQAGEVQAGEIQSGEIQSGEIWGLTVWETDRLPQTWPKLMQPLDGMIVPTEWNRKIVSDSGFSKSILVFPHASEFQGVAGPEHEVDALRRSLPPLSDQFVFYSINAWMERKGTRLLIETFAEAFNGDDKVILLLKTSPGDFDRNVRSWRRGFRTTPLDVRGQVQDLLSRPNAAKIHLITEDYSAAQMRALHQLSDCYVSLPRGEGWGLGAFEAAWFGKPVIMTGFGGQTAFLPPESAYLIDYALVPVKTPSPNSSYTADQNWAQPDKSHAIATLRQIAGNPSAARSRGVRLRDYVSQNFSQTSLSNCWNQLWKQSENKLRSGSQP